VSTRLLIVSCSATKRPDIGLLPAIERYDGPVFRVLRKARREDRWPADVYVRILSARFGLLRPETPIPTYDQRMTPARARQLAPAVAYDLTSDLEVLAPTAVLIAVGADYRAALFPIPALELVDHQFLTGRPGERLAAIKAWLVTGSLDPASGERTAPRVSAPGPASR
jgi:hypothetical protein